jgi:uncharacterized protein YjiS (DUF1127 family)
LQHQGPPARISTSHFRSREIDWPWPDWFRDLAPAIARMWEKRRSRQRLVELDEHLLNDIGVTRDQAEREAKKWMWE